MRILDWFISLFPDPKFENIWEFSTKLNITVIGISLILIAVYTWRVKSKSQLEAERREVEAQLRATT